MCLNIFHFFNLSRTFALQNYFFFILPNYLFSFFILQSWGYSSANYHSQIFEQRNRDNATLSLRSVLNERRGKRFLEITCIFFVLVELFLFISPPFSHLFSPFTSFISPLPIKALPFSKLFPPDFGFPNVESASPNFFRPRSERLIFRNKAQFQVIEIPNLFPNRFLFFCTLYMSGTQAVLVTLSHSLLPLPLPFLTPIPALPCVLKTPRPPGHAIC